MAIFGNMKPTYLLVLGLIALAACTKPQTYCNPLDIDYTYMVYNSDQNLSYRSGADPAVVEFRGEYYMFVTRSLGYWHSKDLTKWEFVEPASTWYPQGSNAPAAWNYRDSLLYVCGDPSGSMSILYSDDPASGKWEAVPAILHDLQDPALFIDDNAQAYMFWGSSNVYPIKGKKLDMRDRFLVAGQTVELFNADGERHGWERFGQNHSDTRIAAYIEGPWLTKHDGTYYMQYAAPGTEFNVYGDGVYTATDPLGPYTYQAHNPVSYKPGGYMCGAGHGSTVQGPGGQWWHYGSMSLSAIVNWERRLCAFPTFFDGDGVMWCDTRFGDYPHFAPSEPGRQGEFAGWMLLSYGKPVSASSFQAGRAAEAQGFAPWNRPETSATFEPSNLTDENCKTYWLAATNGADEWAVIDLEDNATVYAIQVNYFDHNTGLYGRPKDLRQRYILEGSLDGVEWFVLENRSKSDKDAPNAYIQLRYPVKARFVRYRNIEVSAPSLAISEIRVFGLGSGAAPSAPADVQAIRCEDRRNALISWKPDPAAQGYNVFWGIAPDKLYSTWMVYGEDHLLLPSLAVDQEYWFAVEAFNSCGVSELVRAQAH